MNTKGIKFLAVLAVLAMAFAAFAVIAPAEENDAVDPVAATKVTENMEIDTAGPFYTTGNVTIASITTANPTIYVKAGTTLTITATTAVYATIIPASAVDEDANKATPVENLSFRTTAGIAEPQTYAVTVDTITTSDDCVTALTYTGAYFKDKEDATTTYTLYKTPATVYQLNDAADQVIVKKGNTTLICGTNTVDLRTYKENVFESAAGVTFTYVGENQIGASGIIAKGELAVTAGTMAINDDDLQTTLVESVPVSAVTGAARAATAITAGTAITYADDVATDIAYAPTATNFVIVGDYVHPDKNPKIAQKLTINAGATFTIPAKSTLTYGNKEIDAIANCTITMSAYSTMDIWGTVKGVLGATAAEFPNVVGADATSVVKIRAGAEVTGFVTDEGAVAIATATVKEVPAVDDADLQGLSGSLDASLTITNAEVPTGKKLTIPEGITLTVTGMLVINSALGMVVDGELIIADGAMLAVNDNTVGVVLGVTGKISNNGIIAKYNPATVSATAGGSVTMKGVNGAVFGIASKKLTVSGEIDAISGANTSAISFNAVNFNKDVTIGENVPATLTGADSTLSGKTMTIEGILIPTQALILKAGSVVDVEGFIAAGGEGIVAQTTDLVGVEKDAAPGKTITFVTAQGTAEKAASPETTHDLTGYTISVVKTPYLTDEEVPVEMYTQYAYISGNLGVTPSLGAGYALADLTPAKITATGSDATTHLFIAEGEELTQNIANAKLVMNTSKLIVEGKLTSKNAIADTVGAIYAITVEEVDTYYAVDYNTGLQGIAGYKGKTVELVGVAGYTAILEDDLIILDKESVTQDVPLAFLEIPEGVELIVSNGGIFAESVFAELDGKIIVEKDADCTPAAAIYQVYSEDEDGTITYCGFVTALDEAEAGDVITLTGEYETDILTIPTGISVIVDTTGLLSVTKSLTIAADASLEVTGDIVIGTADGKTKNVKVIVNGLFDISSTKTPAQFYTYTTDSHGDPAPAKDQTTYALQIVSNGEFIYRTTQAFPEKAVLVGVTYVDGTTTILTTIDNALEAEAAEIFIPGKYTTDEEIELGTSKLTIKGEATIASIDVQGGVIDATNGAAKLTAIINGVYGEAGIATIAVTDFNGSIDDKLAAGEYTMAIKDMTDGSILIASGYVVLLEDDVKVNEDMAFIVAADAVLEVGADANVIDNEGLVDISGMLLVAKNTDLDIQNNGDDAILSISGEVVIGEGAEFEIDDALIYGDIDVFGSFLIGGDVLLGGAIDVDVSDESVANFTINGAGIFMGESTLGADASIMGKIDALDADSYIVMYPGSTLDSEIIKTLKYTEFYINGDLYATAFVVNGATNVNDVKNAAEPAIITAVIAIEGYNMTGMDVATNWIDLAGTAVAVGTKVGAKEAIFFTGAQLTTEVTVSTVKGVSIFIDGVNYASGTTINDVAVGTHTVTATIDPGYKGTTAIAFNGKAVTSSFEITADMVGPATKQILSVTGDISIDTGDIPAPEKESEWTITTILLVVLVILIAVMVIIVLLRMNRS